MDIDVIEIVEQVENHFGIGLPSTVFTNGPAFGDLQGFVVNVLIMSRGRQPSGKLDAEVYTVLRDIVSRQFGIARADIHPWTRWIDVDQA